MLRLYTQLLTLTAESEKMYSKKIVFGKSNYFDGKKYCRRCVVYLYYNGLFCPCCEFIIAAFRTLQKKWWLVRAFYLALRGLQGGLCSGLLWQTCTLLTAACAC